MSAGGIIERTSDVQDRCASWGAYTVPPLGSHERTLTKSSNTRSIEKAPLGMPERGQGGEATDGRASHPQMYRTFGLSKVNPVTVLAREEYM